MSEYFAIPTDTGRALLANAAVAGTTAVVTHMAIGIDGNDPTGAETQLRQEVDRVPIHAVTRPDGAADAFVAEAVLPAASGPYTIREAGLIDASGALVAIAKLPASDKVSVESGALTEFRIRIHVRVANAEVVTLSLDPSVIMASRQWVAQQLMARDLRSAGHALATMRNALAVDAEATARAALEARLASLDSKLTDIAANQVAVSDRASRALLGA